MYAFQHPRTYSKALFGNSESRPYGSESTRLHIPIPRKGVVKLPSGLETGGWYFKELEPIHGTLSAWQRNSASFLCFLCATVKSTCEMDENKNDWNCYCICPLRKLSWGPVVVIVLVLVLLCLPAKITGTAFVPHLRAMYKFMQMHIHDEILTVAGRGCGWFQLKCCGWR